MSLRRSQYTDSDGRKKLVLLPEGVPDEEAERGIPIGPPSLEALGLPLDIEVRLSNELFNRGIFSSQDAIKRRADIVGALQSVLKVDAGSIVDLYIGKDSNKNADSKPSENKPNSAIHDRRPSTALSRPQVSSA